MTSDSQRLALIESASRWASASHEAWSDFASAFHEREFAQGDHLVLAGDVLTDVFFVVEGLLRLYYTDREGREWNKTFAKEGSFTGSIASGLLGVPAPFSIQALEPAVVLAARWDVLEALYDRHPALERLGRRLAEWIVVKKEMKERAFLEQTPTERYLAFVSEEPDLFARLPLYHVASYVGVSEVSLSRIRGRLARQARAAP
ncbi:MAG: Crp/Fnr family transcriptional regulator [Bacteroidetes bacterium]|nr:MAG: Crp/Fnr family transcriptional regulator [Bacteroidota bacterium]